MGWVREMGWETRERGGEKEDKPVEDKEELGKAREVRAREMAWVGEEGG